MEALQIFELGRWSIQGNDYLLEDARSQPRLRALQARQPSLGALHLRKHLPVDGRVMYLLRTPHSSNVFEQAPIHALANLCLHSLNLSNETMVIAVRIKICQRTIRLTIPPNQCLPVLTRLGPKSSQPSSRCRPTRQFRDSHRIAVLLQLDPFTFDVI